MSWIHYGPLLCVLDTLWPTAPGLGTEHSLTQLLWDSEPREPESSNPALGKHQLRVGVLGVNCTALLHLSFATHSWSWEVELLGTKSFPSPNYMAAS